MFWNVLVFSSIIICVIKYLYCSDEKPTSLKKNNVTIVIILFINAYYILQIIILYMK